MEHNEALKPVFIELDRIELALKATAEKGEAEIKHLGKQSVDTKSAIETLGIKQRELADQLLDIQQKATAEKDDVKTDDSWGAQFIKSADYGDFVKRGVKGRVSFEVKNTITNTIGSTFSDRKPGLIDGAFRVFTIEDLLTAIPTSSNAIDWVRENVFTSAAAETAEGVIKPESSLTFAPATMPVATVAHWIKITRQLAADNASLAAYINTRMAYGVQLRVETQLISGNGVAPNLSGLTLAGNFTAHGYTSASLTALGLSPTNRFDLIGKMVGDCSLADYPADVIVLNTADWWTMRLIKGSDGQYMLGAPSMSVAPTLFGLPVVASNAMPSDNVLVGSLRQAATLHNREGLVIDISDQDTNNFQLNLLTIRAERRLALTVEKPAAVRYGDLTPA